MSAAPGKTRFALSAAVLLLGGCSADERAPPAPRAVAAPAQGELRPLSEILQFARGIVDGKVIDVELESEVDFRDGRRHLEWVYEIEILTEANHVVELEIDAVTGQLLEIDGAPWPAGIERPRE